jgi:hypothetical protein
MSCQRVSDFGAALDEVEDAGREVGGGPDFGHEFADFGR